MSGRWRIKEDTIDEWSGKKGCEQMRGDYRVEAQPGTEVASARRPTGVFLRGTVFRVSWPTAVVVLVKLAPE